MQPAYAQFTMSAVITTATYTGSLACEATHADSQATLKTVAPKDNQGDGSSFSPTDLVGVALGTCMLITMGIYARREGIAMEGATVETQKHMTSQGPRRIARLVCHLRLPAALTDEEASRLLRVAEACPVKKSLHPDTEIIIETSRL